MSGAAAEFYAEQFGFSDDMLATFLAPATVDIAGKSPHGIDVHTWLDRESTQASLGSVLHRKVTGNFDVVRPLLRAAGVSSPYDPNDPGLGIRFDAVRGMELHRFSSQLARTLVNRQVAAGKLNTLGMEVVTPDELPAAVRNNLHSRSMSSKGSSLQRPYTVEGFDAWYRALGTVRTGSFVGTLACGILVRPYVSPARPHSFQEFARVADRITMAPFPRSEVTAGLLDEANRLAAATLEGVQMLRSYTVPKSN